jgi:lambda family phage portal protein
VDKDLFGPIDVGTWNGTVAAPQSTGLTVSHPQSIATSGVGRRWEAADTDRLNEAHWQPVTLNMNDVLETQISELQARCRHEAANNAVIDAGIETQQTNVVGRTGPRLQVLTDSARFNDDAEAIFRAWAENCEYQDGLSLMELVEGWTAQWAFNGEALVQEIIGRTVSQYKLHDLGAESFDMSVSSQLIYGGIELNEAQQVIAYHVADPDNPAVRQRLRKEFTLHMYHRRFALQRRGIPTMASALPSIADTRDYDDQVMDAARALADAAIIMSTDDPELIRPTLPTDTKRKRRMLQYAAPGWRPTAVSASQPAANYKDFRKEKHTDIAGSIGEQPHMIFRRDASNHNMSSARFDGSRYALAIDRFHTMMQNRMLNLIARRVIRIAQLTGILGPTPRSKVPRRILAEFPSAAITLAWEWPKQPPIDPLKDAMAQRIRLENGTVSLSDAIIEDGRRPEEVMKKRAIDNENLEKAGLPKLGGALPTDPALLTGLLTQPDDPATNQTTDETAPDTTAPITADTEFTE